MKYADPLNNNVICLADEKIGPDHCNHYKVATTGTECSPQK